jgi:tetratricopeptide (TPR) repeat protein
MEAAMKRQWSIPGLVVSVCAALCLGVAAPAFAQLGALQGRIVDESGQPVADAAILLEFQGGIPIKFESKSNEKGEWVQGGLNAVGRWNISVSKDGATGFANNVEVAIGATRMPDIVVRMGGASSAAEEAARAKELAAAKTLLDEVNAALAANDFDTAIAKLNEAVVTLPTCAQCYTQLGDLHSRRKEYPQAEVAFKKAVEIDAKSADAYDGLASLYNSTNRLAEAADASAKAMELNSATGGGDATSAYNAGAIMMNSGKVAEAKAQFQRAIQLDPKMAEAHFQLGMTFINEGNVGEAIKALEQYLSLAPGGPNAQMAKDMLPELQKMQ